VLLRGHGFVGGEDSLRRSIEGGAGQFTRAWGLETTIAAGEGRREILGVGAGGLVAAYAPINTTTNTSCTSPLFVEDTDMLVLQRGGPLCQTQFESSDPSSDCEVRRRMRVACPGGGCILTGLV
jgi:hypothetical protein